MSAGLAGHWFGPADEEWYHCAERRSVSDQLRELMLLRNIAHHGSPMQLRKRAFWRSVSFCSM